LWAIELGLGVLEALAVDLPEPDDMADVVDHLITGLEPTTVTRPTKRRSAATPTTKPTARKKISTKPQKATTKKAPRAAS
jgi:hypothetical protein